MLYPLKFRPLYKNYIWGGRNLKRFGKKLPEGKTAESWEVSCHPDGVSVVSNGIYSGTALPELIGEFGRELVGNELPQGEVEKFPLLVKLIDANEKLSVQVHPDDGYAALYEKGELGKNEAWYVLDAKQGARLVYDVLPGVTAESFERAVSENRIESCLKYVQVYPGDVLNIPAGLVHAIGEGILIAEIQQNSNTTYRVYDYDRVDAKGNKRPLHIDKALDVIDFNSSGRREKTEGLECALNARVSRRFLIANRYFSLELYRVYGHIDEYANGSRFSIYVFIDGEGEIQFRGGAVKFSKGESVLIPAALGEYRVSGKFKALRSYVPDIEKDVTEFLLDYGYTRDEIYRKIAGFGRVLAGAL